LGEGAAAAADDDNDNDNIDDTADTDVFEMEARTLIYT